MKYIPFLLILVTLCNCGKHNDIKHSEISISIDCIKEVTLDEIFDDIRFVKLETNDSCLMKTPTKTIVHNNSIYLSDGRTIYEYNQDGKHIKTISYFGKAMNEYIDISDFNVLNNNNIILLDGPQKKLIVYSPQGEFVKHHKLDRWMSSFGILNDSLIVLNATYTNDDRGDKFTVFNINSMSCINSFQPIISEKINYMHFSGQNNFSEFNMSLLFNESMDNQIYEITTKGLVPKYEINIKGKNPPQSFFSSNFNNVMEFIEAFRNNGYVCGTPIYQEGENHILFRYFGSDLSNMCVYNKLDMTYTNFRSIILANGISAIDSYDIQFNTLSDGSIVLNIPASCIIKDEGKSYNLPFNAISTDDNPIICIAKLK